LIVEPPATVRLREVLTPTLNLVGELEVSTGAEGADLRLGPDGDMLVYEQTLTPVDRFSSVLEGVTLDELKAVWTGTGTTPNLTTIYPSQEIMPALQALLGAPSAAVKPQAPEAVEAAVWSDPLGIGIVPFEALNVRLRALELDGVTVTDNRMDPSTWPLTQRVYLTALSKRGKSALESLAGKPPLRNRDPEKLTVLIMTGVTAMARGTAAAIERAGDYAFPARLVGPELAAADITIISNEIPFVAGCVPNNTLNNLILCSKPEYFASLEASGVDAVGLSGNHQNDFGYANMLDSLAFYQTQGIPVYGGGKDASAARAPIFLEHHGNRLAFLGANQYGPATYTSGTGEQVSAWAGSENPGSARFNLGEMVADIQSLSGQADLVLAEAQHTEFDAAGNYTIAPIPQQEADFRALADAGADIVTGVQAHAPQAVELRDDGVILYGLGNLYFDQTWSWATRTGLVPRHAIYEGKLINTELLVTVIEPDMQLRWATSDERIGVLRAIFDASRW
jgi:poly-gamma-glutamate synthesis protein (capsule biosynthesis protein)